MISELRPYQLQALDDIRASVRGGVRRLVVQAATGAGKTKLAAAIVEGCREKGNRVAFVCPAIDLIDQTVESFYAEGVRGMGVIQANHTMTDWSQPVQICSIQTIQARGAFPEAKTVMFDEVHRLHEAHKTWLGHADWKTVPFIGLSATPWTRGLGKYFDSLLIAATTADLIEQGYLSKFRVFATGHPDLSNVKTVAGDYHEGQLSDAMQDGQLTADIIRTWQEKWGKPKTLCFGVDKAHAKSIQERFIHAGVNCGYQDAETTQDERKDIKRKFHSGEYPVVSNIQTLTTGVDWDVRCLILARPTRSEMLFVQIIGRALRTAPGKDCLARDTLILTDRGEVKIQDVTLDHKLWDGVQFVCHAGSVCKGVRPVIAHDGLVATADHEVMTDEGWKTFKEARSCDLRITQSGSGRHPIRIAQDSFPKNRWGELQFARRGGMRTLLATTYDEISQYFEAAGNGSLPSLQWAVSSNCSDVVIRSMPITAREMLQSIKQAVQELWWPRDRISVWWSERGLCLGYGKFGNSKKQKVAIGSHQQRWPLRAGEFALGSSNYKYEQYKSFRIEREIHKFSAETSSRKICGQNFEPINSGDDRTRNIGSMGSPIIQAEREVWDIYGAGPLQRFTANGRLVHNCALILDHSDTTQRLGFVTDITHEHLDDGKPKPKKAVEEKKKPLPRECEQCAALMPPRTKICPNCQHESKITSSIMEQDGELVELQPGKITLAKKGRAKEYTEPERRQFFAELKAHAIMKQYKPGWAANQYREKFKGWPPRYFDNVEPAKVLGPDVAMWIKSRMIAWAKSKRNHTVAADAQKHDA